MELIDKDTVVAEIKRRMNEEVNYDEDSKDFASYADFTHYSTLDTLLDFINTLEGKKVETPVIPKHSYFEEIYHCGSEPTWKIGDVLAVYEFYSDYEGEHIYGKITDVKMDETEDWCYTFENGDMVYENRLISDETYKKN